MPHGRPRDAGEWAYDLKLVTTGRRIQHSGLIPFHIGRFDSSGPVFNEYGARER